MSVQDQWPNKNEQPEWTCVETGWLVLECSNHNWDTHESNTRAMQVQQTNLQYMCRNKTVQIKWLYLQYILQTEWQCRRISWWRRPTRSSPWRRHSCQWRTIPRRSPANNARHAFKESAFDELYVCLDCSSTPTISLFCPYTLCCSWFIKQFIMILSPAVFVCFLVRI